MLHRRSQLVSLAIVFAVLTGCGDVHTDEVSIEPRDSVTTSTMSTTTTTTTRPMFTPQELAYLEAADWNARMARLAEYQRELDEIAETARRESRHREAEPTPSLPPPVSAPSPAAGFDYPIGVHGYFTALLPVEYIPHATCVADHESARAGLYTAVSPGGTWRGWMQADASFWRNHAPDNTEPNADGTPGDPNKWRNLADTHNWETAPPYVQDLAYVHGMQTQGPGAWRGAGCEGLAP